jgi:hypothetical protein
MPTNYITLTRQKLYEMVWSEPMISLAKSFGISDVALAKRCRAFDVPIPYRGYWARKAAGQNPRSCRCPGTGDTRLPTKAKPHPRGFPRPSPRRSSATARNRRFTLGFVRVSPWSGVIPPRLRRQRSREFESVSLRCR